MGTDRNGDGSQWGWISVGMDLSGDGSQWGLKLLSRTDISFILLAGKIRTLYLIILSISPWKSQPGIIYWSHKMGSGGRSTKLLDLNVINKAQVSKRELKSLSCKDIQKHIRCEIASTQVLMHTCIHTYIHKYTERESVCYISKQ